MTQKEYDWLQRLEKEVDKHWDELTKWEQKFTEDLKGINYIISKIIGDQE